MTRPKRQDGFTLWELIIVVVLVILFFLAVHDRLLPLRGAAERAKVVSTVSALQSALGMQATKRVITRGPGGLAALARENPLSWLSLPPATSEVAATGPGDMQKGTWTWFPQSNILMYRLQYSQYVEGAHEGEWLRYRVHIDGNDAVPTNLALEELDPVQWTTPRSLEEVFENGQITTPDD